MKTIFSCSIDDGHPFDSRVAEVFIKHDINATFFIPIRNSEGFDVIEDSDLFQLARNFEIGSHTRDHCYLNRLTIEDAYHQIKNGKSELEDIVGKPILGFCYPGGKFRHEHVGLVKQVGFEYARTTKNLCINVDKNPYELSTTIQFYPHTRDVYLRNFISKGDFVNRLSSLKLVLEHDYWIDRLYALFNHALKQGGVFHLWAHSRDIEAIGAWHEFDQFLKNVAKEIPIEDRVTNEVLASKYSRQSS
jgi:peptidoglycan/xylan/chitin deacetylase (PgdA/CDA1 family)